VVNYYSIRLTSGDFARQRGIQQKCKQSAPLNPQPALCSPRPDKWQTQPASQRKATNPHEGGERGGSKNTAHKQPYPQKK